MRCPSPSIVGTLSRFVATSRLRKRKYFLPERLGCGWGCVTKRRSVFTKILSGTNTFSWERVSTLSCDNEWNLDGPGWYHAFIFSIAMLRKKKCCRYCVSSLSRSLRSLIGFLLTLVYQFHFCPSDYAQWLWIGCYWKEIPIHRFRYN